MLNDLNEKSAEEIRDIIEDYMAEHPGSGGGEVASDEEVQKLLRDTWERGKPR